VLLNILEKRLFDGLRRCFRALRSGCVAVRIVVGVFAGVIANAESDTEVIDIGSITRESDGAPIPIRVESTDSALASVMRKLFATHGAYVLVEPEDTDFSGFVFRFDPVDAGVVRLTVESGRPGQTQFTRDVSGPGTATAAVLAGDLAVRKTLDIPGYFSGKLAFVSDATGTTEIYVADMAFESVRRLTSDGAYCGGPTISPDGRKLLYTSYFRNGFPDIYDIDLTSGKRSLFAGYKGTNTGATFHPSGHEVAMVTSATGNAELYVCDTRGKIRRRLTRTESAVEADPSWSPDGKRIVFTSDRLGRPQLFQTNAAGGSANRVPTKISGYCAEPDWNPRKPDEIVFTIRQGRGFKIAIFRFSTGRSSVLKTPLGDAVEPVWTGDGRHLVFTLRSGPRRRLMLFDTVTGKSSFLHRGAFGNTFQADYLYSPANIMPIFQKIER